MTDDQITRIAHDNLIAWFNSKSVEYVDFKNAFQKFARLIVLVERLESAQEAWQRSKQAARVAHRTSKPKSKRGKQ